MNWMDDANHIQYGIKNHKNQMVMATPCIGLGIFDESDSPEYRHSHLRHRNSIACCSRGGGVWVIPNDPNSENSQQQIIMYQMPYDQVGDDDGLPRYIQGFTAGYVKVKYWRSTDVRMQPLMFHAWSGGLIDVYACDMAMELEETVEENKTLFELLLENGSIHALVHDLLESKLDHLNEIDPDLLAKAREECNEVGKDVDDIVKKMTMVGTQGYEVFNDVLYTLINLTASST